MKNLLRVKIIEWL